MNLTKQPSFTTGRNKAFSFESSIHAENVKRVVETALLVHNKNVEEIEWLFQLYRGNDAVIQNRVRQSGANESINYKAFVSYYSLIADYAANLFMQNPLVLVNGDGEERVSEGLIEYGKVHRDVNKYARDKTTAYHAAICGVGYRFVELDKNTVFKDSVLSPTSVLPIYGDDTDDEAMAMVYITQVKDEDLVIYEDITQQKGILEFGTKNHYTVYTDDWIFSWEEGDKEVTTAEAMPWGCPIIEYKLNPFYIGSFERVTSLIHLLSVLRSDGVNGVVQSIAGLILGKNVGIPIDNVNDTDDEKKNKAEIRANFREQLKEYRQLWVNDTKENPVSLEYIATELFNADIDVLYRGIQEDITTICNIPNSVVNLGGSGNAGAATEASGIGRALENAKNAEPYWFESVRRQTRAELKISHYSDVLDNLNIGDIDFAMQRSVSVDPITASQAYSTLIQTGVKPADAARFADLTADPESWEKRVLEYRVEEEERSLDYAKRETELRLRERETEAGTEGKTESESGSEGQTETEAGRSI